MSDRTERLRWLANYLRDEELVYNDTAFRLRNELISTADEIERLWELEERVTNQEKVIENIDKALISYYENRKKLEADNAKLRARLNHVALCNSERLDKAGLYCEVCDGLAKDAVDALAAIEGET